MAQISANTLTYDQIYLKIREFYSKELQNQFVSNQQRLQEYKKLVTDLYESLGAPMTTFEPFINGEPPVSAKFNKYSQALGQDLAVISKQIDYLNAKIVNAFNLFNQEIDTEKKYFERVASKAKILQMYSQAPAEDITYIGDSFDNEDQVDVAKISLGLNSHIENGALTLPILRTRPWYVKVASIDTVESNGFLGNDHQVFKDINADQSEVYKYIYINNPGISSITAIPDSNALTYFEYEGLNVDRTSNSDADVNLVSEDEFSYLADKKVLPNKTEGTLVNWSNFNLDNPLKLSMIFQASASTLVNTLTISPYFGSMNLVKVTSIKATLRNGDIQEILAGPLYIGSSFTPLNLQVSELYYYNQAVLRFAEVYAQKFEITFEQDNYNDIEIHHAYWKPNYQVNTGSDSPFYGLSRFSPGALSRDAYELIEYDRYDLVPPVTTPNQFKNIDKISKTVKVRLKKKQETFEGYVITFDVSTSKFLVKTKNYFYNYNLFTNDVPNDFLWVSTLSDLFTPDQAAVDNYGSPKYSLTEAELTDDLARVKSYLSANGNQLEGTISPGGPAAIYLFSNVKIEKVNFRTTTQAVSYQVPLTLQRELYKAKRKAIGLRDVSFDYQVYSDRSEIVSIPYEFDTPVESLMISAESTVDNLFNNKIQINYYVSVNNSSWIQISPIQLSFSGVSEVLVFNKNIPTNYQIPGVAYLNYPEIATEITSIRVKIELIKDKSINVTPSVYSYKLIAKVKKL